MVVASAPKRRYVVPTRTGSIVVTLDKKAEQELRRGTTAGEVIRSAATRGGVSIQGPTPTGLFATAPAPLALGGTRPMIPGTGVVLPASPEEARNAAGRVTGKRAVGKPAIYGSAGFMKKVGEIPEATRLAAERASNLFRQGKSQEEVYNTLLPEERGLLLAKNASERRKSRKDFQKYVTQIKEESVNAARRTQLSTMPLFSTGGLVRTYGTPQPTRTWIEKKAILYAGRSGKSSETDVREAKRAYARSLYESAQRPGVRSTIKRGVSRALVEGTAFSASGKRLFGETALAAAGTVGGLWLGSKFVTKTAYNNSTKQNLSALKKVWILTTVTGAAIAVDQFGRLRKQWSRTNENTVYITPEVFARIRNNSPKNALESNLVKEYNRNSSRFVVQTTTEMAKREADRMAERLKRIERPGLVKGTIQTTFFPLYMKENAAYLKKPGNVGGLAFDLYGGTVGFEGANIAIKKIPKLGVKWAGMTNTFNARLNTLGGTRKGPIDLTSDLFAPRVRRLPNGVTIVDVRPSFPGYLKTSEGKFVRGKTGEPIRRATKKDVSRFKRGVRRQERRFKEAVKEMRIVERAKQGVGAEFAQSRSAKQTIKQPRPRTQPGAALPERFVSGKEFRQEAGLLKVVRLGRLRRDRAWGALDRKMGEMAKTLQQDVLAERTARVRRGQEAVFRTTQERAVQQYGKRRSRQTRSLVAYESKLGSRFGESKVIVVDFKAAKAPRIISGTLRTPSLKKTVGGGGIRGQFERRGKRSLSPKDKRITLNVGKRPVEFQQIPLSRTESVVLASSPRVRGVRSRKSPRMRKQESKRAFQAYRLSVRKKPKSVAVLLDAGFKRASRQVWKKASKPANELQIQRAIALLFQSPKYVSYIRSLPVTQRVPAVSRTVLANKFILAYLRKQKYFAGKNLKRGSRATSKKVSIVTSRMKQLNRRKTLAAVNSSIRRLSKTELRAAVGLAAIQGVKAGVRQSQAALQAQRLALAQLQVPALEYVQRPKEMSFPEVIVPVRPVPTIRTPPPRKPIPPSPPPPNVPERPGYVPPWREPGRIPERPTKVLIPPPSLMLPVLGGKRGSDGGGRWTGKDVVVLPTVLEYLGGGAKLRRGVARKFEFTGIELRRIRSRKMKRRSTWRLRRVRRKRR